MRPLMLLAVTLGLAAGCGRAAKDFEDICHASQRAGVEGVTDPAERAQRIALWMEKRLRTNEARRSMAALAPIRCEDKGPILIEAAKEAGYTGPCPMGQEAARQCAASAIKLRELQQAPPTGK